MWNIKFNSIRRELRWLTGRCSVNGGGVPDLILSRNCYCTFIVQCTVHWYCTITQINCTAQSSTPTVIKKIKSNLNQARSALKVQFRVMMPLIKHQPPCVGRGGGEPMILKKEKVQKKIQEGLGWNSFKLWPTFLKEGLVKTGFHGS